MRITARVQTGWLMVDEPTTLPEGTEVALLPLDPGDWLDEGDRASLHAALQASDTDCVRLDRTPWQATLDQIGTGRRTKVVVSTSITQERKSLGPPFMYGGGETGLKNLGRRASIEM